MYDEDDIYCFSRRDYMYDTDDSDPYYFDDDYYDDYDSDSEMRYARKMAELRNYSKEKKPKESKKYEKKPKVHQSRTLVDICSKYLALNFPFAYLQDRYPPIPDDLQLKVISYSFPESEEKIRKYAEFSMSSADISYPSKLCESGKVSDMMQIGFRLSATVDENYVTIHFDRGKITSAECTCDSTTNWCTHVIATALMRIRKADSLEKSQVRLPVSDALNELSHQQLLKFSHYLLYHHQNHKIVETAQGLIDKLVNRHGDYSEEEINVVNGAPDPTAGPALDEECHWFVCSKGFKENCSNLIYEPPENLGFAPLVNKEENGILLHELWYKKRCQPPLVKDEIDLEVGSEFYCTYSLQRRQDSSTIVETLLELLKDDRMSGLVAIKSCTEQVLSRMEKKGSPYHSQHSRHSHVVNKSFYPCGSPAMGFTARPFRCWTLVDELSTLWQLAVLNPKLKMKEREQLTNELINWNEEATLGCRMEKLKPWKALEVTYNLCQCVDWRRPEMQSIVQGHMLADYAITGCTLVRINLPDCSSSKEGRSLQCHLPYCFSYGTLCFDIHTWCSIIHALHIYNYKTAPVNIAFGLSLALITLYRYHVETRSRISHKVPVLENCTLGQEESESDTIGTGTSVASGDKLENNRDPCPVIWPADALLSLRCFAFLYEILSKREDEIEVLLVSHRALDPLGETELGSTLMKVDSAKSLLFQMGAIGLLLPKVSMSTMQQEIEQYDIENWLSFQLLESQITLNDLDFLDHLTTLALNDKPGWPLAPCSSFARVALHHSFKDLLSSAATLDFAQTMTPEIELALQTLDFSLDQDVHPWTLFEFSNAVSWCKLAELSLVCLAGSASHMERMMKCLLKQHGVLGPGLFKIKIASDEGNHYRPLFKSTLDGKSKVSFALAKALSARGRNSSKKKVLCKLFPLRQLLTGVKTKGQKEFPNVNSPSTIMVLKKCAIRLGAHSVFLEKTSNRSYSHGSAIRWLIDYSIECGTWGIRCLINSHPDINDFLQHEEAINLCRSILKKKDDGMIPLIKDVMLSLLRQAIRSGAADNVKDILVTCRESNKSTMYLLTPWVCQHIRDMARTAPVHFESLMFASEQVFKCYTHKLFQTIHDNQRTKNLEGGLGLRRLFNEGNDDPDSEDSSNTLSPPNPYLTHRPHAYLELAFELGIMGLDVLPNEDDVEMRRYHRNGRDKKERLMQLCDLVCYISTKKWLNQTNDKKIAAITDGRSFVSSSSTDISAVSIDQTYISRFVNDLLESDMSPMMLFDFLCEMSVALFSGKDANPKEADANFKQDHICKAVGVCTSLRLLRGRIESRFRDLLLGPKVGDLVKSVTRRRPRSTPKDLHPEFEYHDLEDATLRETLKAAKQVFEGVDSSGESFKKLIYEMQKQHPQLTPVLDGVLKGEEVPRPREGDHFRNPFFFWPFLAEFSFSRHHPLEDWY